MTLNSFCCTMYRTFLSKEHKMTQMTTTTFLKFAKTFTVMLPNVTDTFHLQTIAPTNPTNKQVMSMLFVPSLNLSYKDPTMKMDTFTSMPMNMPLITSTTPTQKLRDGGMLLLLHKHLDWCSFL